MKSASSSSTPVRPVPAASLVLLRRDAADGFEVLLGRRHERAGFMPGVYVVPGGRVEASDSTNTGFAEDLRPLPAGLDRETRRRAPAIVRAALRETFEETGLLYGEDVTTPPGRSRPRPADSPVWAQFERERLQPAFERLVFIARAITPAFSPRRFHTRFLLGDGGFARGRIGGDGELEDIGWYRLAETGEMPMANITRMVLSEAVRHYGSLKKAGAAAPRRPAAMFLWCGSKHEGGIIHLRRQLEA